MATTPSILVEVSNALGKIPTTLNAASQGADVFEAYIFTLVLRAASLEGATVSFENVDESAVGVLRLRTSPGHIWSTNQIYSHAVLIFEGRPELEVHTGVYLSGCSGLIHEADVLVVLRDEAKVCRAEKVPPRSKRAVVAIECKFYSSNLGIALGRGFVGLCSDLSAREAIFVTNTQGTSVEKLLTHQRKKWQSLVEPSLPINVNRLRNSLQDAFKEFKAKYA